MYRQVELIKKLEIIVICSNRIEKGLARCQILENYDDKDIVTDMNLDKLITHDAIYKFTTSDIGIRGSIPDQVIISPSLALSNHILYLANFCTFMGYIPDTYRVQYLEL